MATDAREILAEAIRELAAELRKPAGAAESGDRGQGTVSTVAMGEHRGTRVLTPFPLDAEKQALRVLDAWTKQSVEILPLSGSTDGRGIKVVATATAGTTVHTAGSGRSSLDLLYLWAVNSDSTDRKLTIEFGGTTAPDDLIEFTVPAEDGLYPVLPGLPLRNGLVVKAFCASANVVLVHGYVERRSR